MINYFVCLLSPAPHLLTPVRIKMNPSYCNDWKNIFLLLLAVQNILSNSTISFLLNFLL